MRNACGRTTIGVCVKNSEKTIEESIKSILKQKFPVELMQIIIVDGCSTDRTMSIVKNITSDTNFLVEIFSDKGKGLGAARQIVVDNAKGDYIIFVDGDVELPGDFVKKQIDYMEKYPKVAVAVGTYMFREGSESLISAVSCLFNFLSNPHAGTDATICRVEALKQVNGFDENIIGASEDKDLIFRIQKKGWLLSANEEALFYHNCRENFRGFWKEQAWFGFGNHYLYHKHRNLGRLWRELPLGSFRYGFKLAKKGYDLTNRKISFLIPLLLVTGKIAWWIGFFKAHLIGYGHKKVG